MFLDSWDHLITSLSYSNPKYFEYDTVVGALLLEEKKRNNNQETSSLATTVTRGLSSE